MCNGFPRKPVRHMLGPLDALSSALEPQGQLRRQVLEPQASQQRCEAWVGNRAHR